MTSEEHAAVVHEAVTLAADVANSDYAAGRRSNALTAADRSILRDLADRLARRSPRLLAMPAREAAPARLVYTMAFGLGYFGRLQDLSGGVERAMPALVREVLAAL
jgi:hypothetical protein